MGKPPPQTVLEILREAAHAMEAYCKCQITQDKHTVQSVSLALKQTATVNEPASSQTESVLTPIDTRPLLPVVSQEPLDNVAPVLRFPARVASAIAKWGTRHSGKVAIILVALMIAGVIFVVDRRYPQEPGRDADQRKAYNVALAQLYSVAEQLEKVRSGQVPVERLKEALPGVSSLYARLNTPGPRDLKLTAGEICNNIGGEIWRLIRDPQAAAEAYQTSVQLYETLLNEQRDDDSCRRHLVDARLQYAKMLLELRWLRKAKSILDQSQNDVGLLLKRQDILPDDVLRSAEVDHLLGQWHNARREWYDAQKSFSRAIENRERLSASPGQLRDRINRDRGRGYGYIGDTYLALGRLGEAEVAYRESKAIRTQLAAAKQASLDDRKELSRADANFGPLYRARGELTKAYAAYAKAVERLIPSLKQSPRDDFRADIIDYRLAMAELKIDIGDPRAASEHLDSSERLIKSMDGKNIPDDMRRLRVSLLRVWLMLEGNHASAVEAVEDLRVRIDELGNRIRQEQRTYPDWLYLQALVAVLKSKVLGEQQSVERAVHAGEAFAYLKEAINYHYFSSVERLEQDARFHILRTIQPSVWKELIDQCRRKRNSPPSNRD